MYKVSQIHVFSQLLKTDLIILKTLIQDKLIDLFIWITTMLAVNAYLMPAFGLSGDYGSFMLAGLCASAGLFEIWPAAVNFISDLEGEQMLFYYINPSCDLLT